MRKQIIPRYKLLLSYNIITSSHEAYFQFVTQELMPKMQSLGLYFWRVYHTAYGKYPDRQLEFLAESAFIVHDALESDKWRALEPRLQAYVTDYTRKLVEFRESFQF